MNNGDLTTAVLMMLMMDLEKTLPLNNLNNFSLPTICIIIFITMKNFFFYVEINDIFDDVQEGIGENHDVNYDDDGDDDDDGDNSCRKAKFE